jgi:antitoxin (DNA-binding transcriptional repressor) of toxin-antitoxin stability system
MREATLENFASDVHGFVEVAQRERVVLLERGKPVAVVIGVENKDEEDIALEFSPEFWRMIEERRKRPTIPLEDVREALLRDDE